MKPLYTQKQYDKSKSSDKLPCECYQCKKIFYVKKNMLTLVINGHINKTSNFANHCMYCSRECDTKRRILDQEVSCKNCNIKFIKGNAEIKKFPNHFCSHSCSATYNNKRKTHGNVRSKLEKWIEEQLTILYPNLEIRFNKKDAINSELDIYIPSLKLAFELNGIFHYEPIYGKKKLNQIKENDISKTKSCHDAKIDLCIIDTSQQTYVKPKNSQKYLDIITNILNERL